jgi:hypothetical protein
MSYRLIYSAVLVVSPSVMALHDAAQSIPESIWSPDFKSLLVSALEEGSKRYDKLDYSRFGWLKALDIEVLNAMALPLGNVRDPVEIPDASEADNVIIRHITKYGVSQVDLFLLGVALACVCVLGCVLCMYFRLKSEKAALEKDKLGSGSLRGMWDKLRGKDSANGGAGKGSRGRYMALETNEGVQGSGGGGGGSGGKGGMNTPYSATDDLELDEEDIRKGAGRI